MERPNQLPIAFFRPPPQVGVSDGRDTERMG